MPNVGKLFIFSLIIGLIGGMFYLKNEYSELNRTYSETKKAYYNSKVLIEELNKKLAVREEILKVSQNLEEINVNVYWWQRGCEESFEGIIDELQTSKNNPKTKDIISGLTQRITNCEKQADKVQMNLILHKQAQKEQESNPIVQISDDELVRAPALNN